MLLLSFLLAFAGHSLHVAENLENREKVRIAGWVSSTISIGFVADRSFPTAQQKEDKRKPPDELGKWSLRGSPESIEEVVRRGDGRSLQLLIEALKSSDSKEREAAAIALGKLGDKQAVEPLLFLSGDTFESVRESAARALTNLGEPLGDVIFQSLKGSPDAMEELEKRKDGRATAPLVKATGAWDARVRKAAVQSLGRLPDDDERIFVSLKRSLSDMDRDVREAAVWSLVKLGDGRSADPILQAMKDGDANVRTAAAWALGSFRDQQAVEALAAALTDRFFQVREAAAWSLGNIGDRSAVDAIIVAVGDTNHSVRAAAIWTLGNLGNGRAVSPLIRSLEDESPKVREASVWVLGKLGDRRAIDPLILSLGDENIAVRQAAASTLEKSGESLGMEILDALNGSRVAIAKVARRKDPRTIVVLIKSLGRRDQDLRRAATRLLGEMNEPLAVEKLISMAGGWNPRDRFAAMMALWNMDQSVLLTAFRIIVQPASLAYLFISILLALSIARIARRKKRTQTQSS